MNYYLTFTNEVEVESILYSQSDGRLLPNYINIDTIGVIYKPTGELDADDNPVMAPVVGWHVNVLVVGDEDATKLEPYRVYPATPHRIWAGSE